MIRVAKEADAPQLLAIYAWYVEHTAITLECIVPTEEEFRGRIRKTLQRYPYLVLEEEGTILGYAYAGPLNTRQAFDWSVECSIYVAHGQRGQGLGNRLYTALEQALALQQVVNLSACIAWPEVEDEYLTRNSVGYHSHRGYTMVGQFHRCAFKFGRWYGMVWMEKHIAPHAVPPAPFRPFDEIREQLREQYEIA